MVISSQLDFIQNAKLGYNKDFVVTFPTFSEGEAAQSILDRLRIELNSESSVLNISGHAFEMGQSWLYINIDENGSNTYLIGEDITTSGYTSNLEESSVYFYTNFVDERYIPTLGIKLLEGRNFSKEHPSDKSEAIVINETAARMMNLENPVGSKLPRGFKDAFIVGVVEDFHYYPLHRKIEPLVLHMNGISNMTSVRHISAHLSSNNVSLALEKLKDTWQRVTGGIPFEYKFLDERVGEQYANELRWKKIVNYSSMVSILVTCLGLFGLTSLAVVKRSKEIAIRKVLGASTASIISALTKEFILLVGVANIIAWPLAFYMMNNWLTNFTFRIKIGLGLFLAAGLISLSIALATLSYHAIKAASANPVDSIQTDQ
ncbi:MAG: FtsX-like permease family protein [Candidatus Zixiibacteriota bacterium]